MLGISNKLEPFVLDVMIVHILSRYGDVIIHPLHTLGLFLHFFAYLDFTNVVITMTDLFSVATMEPLIDMELKVIKEQKLAEELNMKYRVLFNSYRHRYEATVTANKRVKEESVTVESLSQTTDGSDRWRAPSALPARRNSARHQLTRPPDRRRSVGARLHRRRRHRPGDDARPGAHTHGRRAG